MRNLVVGTRGSALAMWQARWVVERLQGLHPGLAIRIERIQTEGDRESGPPLWQIGGTGLFVKEIEKALLEGRIDVAVHSMKDLPSSMPVGLSIAAVPEREDPRDVLVSRRGLGLSRLPKGARVGTSSSRRRAQLLAYRPDLEIVPLRGNVDTRLRKASGDDLDAAVLAAAGLGRLGYSDRITEYIPLEVCLPAPGQGALAVQVREDDTSLIELLAALDHRPTRAATDAERAFLRAMGGGCQLPMACLCRDGDGGTLVMDALVASPNGEVVLRERQFSEGSAASELGVALAEKLLARGAGRLLSEVGQ